MKPVLIVLEIPLINASNVILIEKKYIYNIKIKNKQMVHAKKLVQKDFFQSFKMINQFVFHAKLDA